jgi:hypothetical protein
MSQFNKVIAEWKKTGTVKYVIWHTFNDDQVCSVCRRRNGKKFLLSEIEHLIPAHEGCRCWIDPGFDFAKILLWHGKFK